MLPSLQFCIGLSNVIEYKVSVHTASRVSHVVSFVGFRVRNLGLGSIMCDKRDGDQLTLTGG